MRSSLFARSALRLSILCAVLFAPAAVPRAQNASPPAQADADALARVKPAVQALMQHYDPARGLWGTEGWWNAANTTTVLGEAAAIDPASAYPDTLRNTFNNAQKVHPQFRNEFYDDEGWWALAWIQAYDVTHRPEYLAMAQSIFADMSGGWDDTCHGGIWWKKDRHYKNAIANELFLSVAAHLATRAPQAKRSAYLAWASREWSWFASSGMINTDNLVNDGLTPDCKNNGRTPWTYNQGVLIGGLAELSAPAHDPSLLQLARKIADAAMHKLTDKNMVLHDRTEPKCSEDTVQFKGIFTRNLILLHTVSPAPGDLPFIHANADSIWTVARTADNEFSCSWSGPPLARGAGASTSALDALVAAATMQ